MTGIVENYSAFDYPFDRIKRLYDINVHGAFFTAREAARHMIPMGGGSIVLVGSMSANVSSLVSHLVYAKSSFPPFCRTPSCVLRRPITDAEPPSPFLRNLPLATRGVSVLGRGHLTFPHRLGPASAVAARITSVTLLHTHTLNAPPRHPAVSA